MDTLVGILIGLFVIALVLTVAVEIVGLILVAIERRKSK